MNKTEKRIQELKEELNQALAYWGEPELHKQLDELIELCKNPPEDIY